MNGLIRLSAAVNRVNVANPIDCADEIIQILQEKIPAGNDITVFPKMALCSPSCGALLTGDSLLEQCAGALDALIAATENRDGYLIVGLPVEDLGRTASAMAVLHRGELVALIPTVDNPSPLMNGGYSENFVPPETVFSCGRLRFCVLGCDLDGMALRAAAAVATGCDLLIIPAYERVYAGYIDQVCDVARSLSRSCGCAVAVVNGGVGDTTSPYIYQGFIAIYECGEQLATRRAGQESFACTVDLDVDIIHACKKPGTTHATSHSIRPATDKPGILRALTKNPWLPEHGRERYLDELFELQVRSLAGRMENIGVTRLVLGVSGGLDSTAALLASAAACDLLGLPRENIVGVTMPGFGTSDHTYYNALALLEQLGVTRRDISIRAAVQQHFEDIGHSGRKDTTYENAQARERAQILLDIANDIGGLVVGTGDLSEESLGFCTFSGDHIANYNVNVCLTKTVLRELARRVTQAGRVSGVEELVASIIDTPVSPELLPPGEQGEIQQRTEDILGPYLLHDFFTYYFARYRFRPSKLYYYACEAFRDDLKPAFIKEKLALYFRRFFAAQFKRACAPDSASITEVNLNGVNFYVPSDLDPSALLRELESTRD